MPPLGSIVVVDFFLSKGPAAGVVFCLARAGSLAAQDEPVRAVFAGFLHRERRGFQVEAVGWESEGSSCRGLASFKKEEKTTTMKRQSKRDRDRRKKRPKSVLMTMRICRTYIPCLASLGARNSAGRGWRRHDSYKPTTVSSGVEHS